MKKDEYIKLHQSYLNEYIKFADAKALAIISINGFILNFNFSKRNIKFHNTEDIFNFTAFILLQYIQEQIIEAKKELFFGII